MLSGKGSMLFGIASALAVIGLGAAVGLGAMQGDHFRRFLFSYLTGYAYFLSIALGALFFVLIQHLTKAAWSVTVRRIAEGLTATLPFLALLSIPIIASVWMQDASLYRWALPENATGAEQNERTVAPADAGRAPLKFDRSHAEQSASGHADGESAGPEKTGEEESSTPPRSLDELTLKKRAFLNPTSFTIGVVVYFLSWCLMARKFRRESILQDGDSDIIHTQRLQVIAGPCVVLLGITLTFAAFHMLMSLDPHWYSTIFGGYYFAGCAMSVFAAMIVITFALQHFGYLGRSVTIEHYHDLGKFQFAFVFFWGYIAFSQFMLLWYASIPETVEWLLRRGATTVDKDMNGWTNVSLALLVGQLLIPFAALISRHVKRKPAVLMVGAVWILVFHYVDIYWIVMPEMRQGFGFSLIDVAALVGIGGVFLAVFAKALGSHALRPMADPRLSEGLALVNM